MKESKMRKNVKVAYISAESSSTNNTFPASRRWMRVGSAEGGDGDLLAIFHHALHQLLGRAVGRRALVIRPRVRAPLHDLLAVLSPPVLIVVGPVHHLVLTPILIIIPCSGSWWWRRCLGLRCLCWLWGLCVHRGSSLVRLLRVVVMLLLLLLLLGRWQLWLVVLWLVQRRRRDLRRVMVLMMVLLRGRHER